MLNFFLIKNPARAKHVSSFSPVQPEPDNCISGIVWSKTRKHYTDTTTSAQLKKESNFILFSPKIYIK